MMKTIFKCFGGIVFGLLVFTSCSEKQGDSLDEMLTNKAQQDQVLSWISENHDLSMKLISLMLKEDHTTGMMVDGLVGVAAKDSILAGKISDMIIGYPDLMLLTMHHFLPVIDTNEHLCTEFCDHMMEHSNIAETMCMSMQESDEMNCCH